MPAYSYEALDTSGHTKKGVIAADSLRDARQKLNAISLFPVAIKKGKAKKSIKIGSFSLTASKALKSKDLTLLTRQMATMFGAGTPVEEALFVLASQNDKPVIKNILTNVRAQVSEGKTLSEAMSSERSSFPRLYRAMVAAGETSGNLSAIMERIADYYEKSEDIKNKISTAMIYPIVLSIVAFAVIIILMTAVVPKVVSQFERLNTELPFLTRAVMGISEFFIKYGVFLILGAFLLSMGFGFLYRQKKFRWWLHGIFLKLPFVGNLLLSVASARFARTMGTLIEGGSPVLQSIKAAKQTISNEVIRDAIDSVYMQVHEGKALSAALKTANIFPSLLVYMCSMGERSGRLSFLLIKIADYLENEFDSISKKALSLLEPVIVIIMGLAVGMIVMSIMLPIMQLNSLVLG